MDWQIIHHKLRHRRLHIQCKEHYFYGTYLHTKERVELYLNECTVYIGLGEILICLRMDIDSVIDMTDSLCGVIDAVPVMGKQFLLFIRT